MTSTQRELFVYVFYFDVIGFVDDFIANGDVALDRLRQFQSAARHEFAFGHDNSYIVTLFDNVWCRLNAIEPGTPSLLLEFAGDVMRAAEANGYKYFGAITYGIHRYDVRDRMLVGGETFEDLREQHIDAISEPHVRAAAAEKWSRHMRSDSSVWVFDDVADARLISAFSAMPDSRFRLSSEPIDLATVALGDGRHWPFRVSVCNAIRPTTAT